MFFVDEGTHLNRQPKKLVEFLIHASIVIMTTIQHLILELVESFVSTEGD